VRKIFLIITGILMFYIVRIFFKRLKNAAMATPSGGQQVRTGNAGTLFSAPKGSSFPSDRVVEEATYTEIEPGPGK